MSGLCRTCGRLTLSRRHWYCADCKMKARHHRDRPKVTTTQAGYGHSHQAVRAAWRSRVEAGGVDCARCGLPIVPGEPWDLGHSDHDRAKYSGPEHRACNRATAGRLPVARLRPVEPVLRTSRVW